MRAGLLGGVYVGVAGLLCQLLQELLAELHWDVSKPGVVHVGHVVCSILVGVPARRL